MWGPALSLLVIAQAPCPGLEAAAGLPPELVAQVAVARAGQARRAGDLARAKGCLDAALETDPSSTLALRARAQLHLQAGRLADAHADAAAAAHLGDADPELLELRALIAARAQAVLEARAHARAARTWVGDLIGVALDDRRAAFEVAELLGEPTARGALAGLVLAGHEARTSDPQAALTLAAQAERDARIADEPGLARMARQLITQVALHGRRDWSAQLGTSIDHLTNPAYVSPEEGGQTSSVRVAAQGNVDARFALGRVQLRTGLRVRQHGLLARRSRFCCLDTFSYRLVGGLSLPLGPDPRAVRLGLVVRWTDVFADRFRFHHASHLEGGPTLAFALGPRLDVDLSFLGVITDFVDTSPADARASSLDRDRVGQRATLGVALRLEWLLARLEAMFINDDAQGDAFDALGAAFAATLEAQPAPDLTVFLGAGITIREFGPVGDKAVIGAAANRTEVRTALRVGARLRLAKWLHLVVDDTFVDSSARAGHDYAHNVLSVGVQTRW